MAKAKPISQTVECVECGEMRFRTREKTSRSKNVQWKDAEGRNWRGRRCPPCGTAHMTKKRLNESSAPLAKLPGNIERAHFAAPGQKIRQCGRCKRDTVNYYYCPPCHVALNTSGDGELEEMTCHHG